MEALKPSSFRFRDFAKSTGTLGKIFFEHKDAEHAFENTHLVTKLQIKARGRVIF